ARDLTRRRGDTEMTIRIAILLAASVAAWGADQPISAGNGTLIVGGRPNKIFLIDEATEKVTGEILCKTGTPANMTLSLDRKRLTLLNIAFEDVEILDLEKKTSVDSFRLSEGTKKMRIFGYEADPLHRFLIL